MAPIQVILSIAVAFIIGYAAGKILEGIRWTRGNASRVQCYGSYYWVIPDDQEPGKRFIAQAFSAPALWFDSVAQNSKKVPGHVATHIVSRVFGSDPSHRFVDTLGWQFGGGYWATLCLFESGEYFLQLKRENTPIATAVTRSACLADAASWLVQHTGYTAQELPRPTHYVNYPRGY